MKSLNRILLLFLVVISPRCDTNPPNTIVAPSTGHGRILVTSNVDSALIYVDNVSTGKYTPDTVSATVGIHTIELEKAGMNPAIQNVEVKKDQVIAVAIYFDIIRSMKTILIEDFSNVSCIPCVTSNQIMESLINHDYKSKITIIRFHTNFPSPNDPFYLAGKSDCDARIDFYKIFASPTVIVDGALRPIASDSNDIKQKTDARLLQPAKFKLTVKDSLAHGTYIVNVTVENTDTANLDFNNLVLQTVVTETEIDYPTPPGSNGETQFHHIMRSMLPGNQGESLNLQNRLNIVAYARQTPLNNSWNTARLLTIAYVQNRLTKEVYQASR